MQLYPAVLQRIESGFDVEKVGNKKTVITIITIVISELTHTSREEGAK